MAVAFVTVKRVGRVLNAMSRRANVKCPVVLVTDAASKVNATVSADGRDHFANNVSVCIFLRAHIYSITHLKIFRTQPIASTRHVRVMEHVLADSVTVKLDGKVMIVERLISKCTNVCPVALSMEHTIWKRALVCVNVTGPAQIVRKVSSSGSRRRKWGFVTK